ncbi:MAG: hypothetical protein P4L22_06285 [Candidatus Babeliales bacterium]|nr:hypothetical protein [Candidatus Babeliales bacterium]
MKKLLCALLFLFAVSSLQIKADPAADFIKKFSLTLSTAGVSGFATFIILRFIEQRILGIDDNKLINLVNMSVSALFPGLLLADAKDDGRINGSSVQNLIKDLKGSRKDLSQMFNILISKSGGINVAAAFVGALLADRMT